MNYIISKKNFDAYYHKYLAGTVMYKLLGDDVLVRQVWPQKQIKEILKKLDNGKTYKA